MIQVVSCDQYNAYVCLASRLGQVCMGWECTCVYDLQIMPPLPLIQGDVCGGVVMGGCDGSGDGSSDGRV